MFVDFVETCSTTTATTTTTTTTRSLLLLLQSHLIRVLLTTELERCTVYDVEYRQRRRELQQQRSHHLYPPLRPIRRQ